MGPVGILRQEFKCLTWNLAPEATATPRGAAVIAGRSKPLIPFVATLSEHLRAFISILDRFSDLGHAREYGETRERYAERLTELSPSFALLTETHLRLSLGHGSDEDAVVVNKLCGLVRNELTASVPFWMRLIGWINPWGWWFTR